MEQDPSARITLSPTLLYKEEWENILTDNGLVARLNELVDLTVSSLDPDGYPWSQDRQDVVSRWQHLINMLGGSASAHGHPLFSNGRGWVDEDRTSEVLEPIDFRSFDASFVENAIILTHSLAVQQGLSGHPGLTVNLNTLNNCKDTQNPELVEHFTSIFDLRDMAEPTESIIGDMSLEDFQNLSEEQRDELIDKLFRLSFNMSRFGRGYGWNMTPQQRQYSHEHRTLTDYSKLIDYDTTDDREIENIRDIRKAIEITELRAERPEFGEVPDNFQELPDRLKHCIFAMFEYFDLMRARYETIEIDTYSMGRLGFEESDLQSLKDHDILVDEEMVKTPGGLMWEYRLSTPYYEQWVSRHYPAEKPSN